MISRLPEPELHVHLIDSLAIGGAQTHLLTIVSYAVQHFPHKHRIVGLLGDGPMRAEFEKLGVPVDVVDIGPAIRSRALGSAVGIVRSLLRELKPVVLEAHLSYARIFGLPAAWLEKVPVRIGFEQGDLYLNAPKFYFGNLFTQFSAQQIVVCSSALKAWSRKAQGLQARRMTVIHNCVDERAFRTGAPPVEGRFGFAPGTTLFCAVGTLGTGVNKRVDIIVQALHEARKLGADAGLLICGDGSLRPAIERQIRDLGLIDHVRMLGLRRDIPNVLATSDVFCHAAPFEPFGIVCLEAMAMERPVIVPDSGGLAEVVEPGITGLRYPALDASALAKAMRSLHDSADLRKRMGAAGRQAVMDRFTVGKYVEKLHAVYRAAGWAH